MLTYSEIKNLCKYAEAEALPICPLCNSRCSEQVCPAIADLCADCPHEITYSLKKRKVEQQEHENEEEAARLQRWSEHLQYVIDDYTDLDAAYDQNAELIKSAFGDFVDAINAGVKKVKEGKKTLKDDLNFVQRFIDGR